MNKEIEEKTIQKRTILITTVLSVVASIAFLVLLIQLAINETTAVPLPTLMAVGLVGLLAGMFITGAWLCRNGRITTGLLTVGVGLLLVILAIPFVTQGRSIYASPLAVALVVAIAPQLFSIQMANRVVTIFVVAGLISIALDAWLPFSRITPNAPPFAIYIFIAALFIFIFYTAWQYRKFKLQTKLLSFLVFVPLLIVAVAGVFLIVRIAGQQRAAVEAEVQRSLTEQVDNILQLISEAEEDVQLVGHSFSLQNYLSLASNGASPEMIALAKTNVQEEFLNFARTRRKYDQIRFIDANGQEVVRVDTASNSTISVLEDSALQDQTNLSFFTEMTRLDPGEVFISPLALNRTDGEIERPLTPVIHFGLPVYQDGQLFGVVVLTLSADLFLRPFATAEQQYYLVDQNGYFLFHPDASKMWGRDLGTGVNLAQELPDVAGQLTTASEPVIFQTSDTLFTQASLTLAAEAEPRWFLLNGTPLSTISAPVDETLQPVQFVLAAALLLTPLIALFVSQSIAAPIVLLAEAAEKMGQGNFDAPIQISSEDEVGVLAHTLKSMNAELAALIDSLEARVAARTKDLLLAVEVNHQVSQVQSLDSLLANAVSLIRERFDLYYTQIYLVEGSMLRLQAGTGVVGRQLLQQGHKLMVGPGSINGTAVSEKRSLIVADTADSPIFQPNPLLPETRSEMAVPLIAREQVVGVLNLQSSEANALTEENLVVFEALAGQLASAVENARLFAEAREAQAAVEAQMKRLTRQGWDTYLDGIHQPEFLGYLYEAGQVTAVTQPTPPLPEQQKWDIQLLDETVGQVIVDTPPEKPLTPAETELINMVSHQVGQQIENLRLLADARRYQQEAEELAHRLIRDGWHSYQAKTAVTGFSYNQQEIQPILPESDGQSTPTLVQPVTIGGESIGTIALADLPEDDEQTREIVAAVSAQLGTHIENLRLSEQSEIARADAERRNQELAVINRLVTQIAASLDLQHSLQIIVDELAVAVGVDQVRMALMQPDKSEMVVIAEHFDHNRSSSALGLTIPLEGNELTLEVIETRQMTVIEDAQNHPRTTPVHEMFREQGIETVVLLPLVVNDEVIGTIGMDILDDRSLQKDRLRLAETIVYQAATAVQNARLFEQTQAALAETEMLYSHSSRLNTATSLDAVLESAAEPGFNIGARDALLIVLDPDNTGDASLGQVAAVLPKGSLPLVKELPLADQPWSRLLPSGGKNILFVGSVSEEERLREEDKAAFREMNVDALALMFLMVGNLHIGQIIIRWDKPQTFTAADERLYGAIAQQASSVVYNRMLFNRTEEALSETAALYQASADLNTAQTFEQVLAALRQHTILGQGSIDVSLNYFDKAWQKDQMPEEIAVLARWSRLPKTPPARYKLAQFPEAENVLQRDSWLICEDVASDERMSERTRAIFMERFMAKSLLYIPLVVAGQWVGFLSGIYPQPTRFPESQIRRLNVLSRQAAVSIQSIRLFEQSQAALAETEALYLGSERIVLSSTETDVLNSLIESTMLQELDRANIFMFEEPVEDGVPQDVTAVAIWENEGVPRTVEIGTQFTVDQVPFITQITPDRSLVVNDVRQDPRVDEKTRDILQQFGMRSFVLYPLVAGNQWLGMVSGQSAAPLFVDEVQVRRVNSLVSQAAVVLQTTLLLRQEQARARREQLLRQITAKVRSSTDIDTIMRTAVTEIGRTLGRRSFIKLGDGQDENGATS